MIFVITLITFALGVYVRRISEQSPLLPGDLISFEFDPYAIGFAVQELVVPVVLIYIFSATALFRRFINDETAPRDTLKLFGVLAMIQLLTLSYYLVLSSLADDQVTFGVLIVVVGSLLGGWRVGLGLGLITMFVNGAQNLIDYPEENLLLLYQAEGLRVLFNLTFWYDLLFWRFLVDMEATSVLWAGVVAGLSVDLLGERRFRPAAALTLQIGIEVGVGYLTATAWDEPALLVSFLIPSAVTSGLAMIAIILIVRNVQAEAAQRKAEAVELALTHAKLSALRAQINPHFLFNALNTIRYFVRTDPVAARRMLLNLSEVLQHTLRAGDFVPLQNELNYVEAYLSLEKKRLDERLQIVWSVQAATWLHYPVPTLILQPVVENAIIHGIAKKTKGGTVSITIEKVNNDLVLRVEDDGPGIAPARLSEILNREQASNALPALVTQPRVVNPPVSAVQVNAVGRSKGKVSIGLRNVDQRLQTLYGDKYRLLVESEVGCGTTVQIKIPIEDEQAVVKDEAHE